MVHGSSLVHRPRAGRRQVLPSTRYRDVMGFVYTQAKFEPDRAGEQRGTSPRASRRRWRSSGPLDSGAGVARRGDLRRCPSPTRSGPEHRGPAWPRFLGAGQSVARHRHPVRAGGTSRSAARSDRRAGHRRKMVDGVFTGRLVGEILHGAGKAHAVRALAIREGLRKTSAPIRACSDSYDHADARRHRRCRRSGRRSARRGPRGWEWRHHRAQGGPDRRARRRSRWGPPVTPLAAVASRRR